MAHMAITTYSRANFLSGLCLSSAVAAVSLLALTARAEVSLQGAHAAVWQDAGVTRCRALMRNDGDAPALISGMEVNGKRFDLVMGVPGAGDLLSVMAAPTELNDGRRAWAKEPAAGSVQWWRVQPNPIPPGGFAEAAVCIAGTEAPALRLLTAGGRVEWPAKPAAERVRLSHVAFDPAGTGLYVYARCADAAQANAARLRVNGREVAVSRRIVLPPSGERTEAQLCLIVRPAPAFEWGGFVAVQIEAGGAATFAVVRACNYFPVNAWSRADTRAELFFDSAKFDVTDASSPQTGDGPPVGAFNAGLWEFDPQAVVRNMQSAAAANPRLPSSTFQFGHFSGTTIPERVVATYGGLADVCQVVPWSLSTFGGGAYSGAEIAHARRHADPKPVVSIPIAQPNYVGARGWPHSAAEVAYAMWTELAEGAKGIRYRLRGSPKHENDGYDDFPLVRDGIGRENLDVQILKPFLRVGDPFDLGRAEGEKLLCKTLLCADYGIVAMVFSEDRFGGKETRAQWTPRRDVALEVALPEGFDAAAVYEAAQGLRPLAFTRHGRSVRVVLPELYHAARVLICFAPPAAVAPPAPPRAPLRNPAPDAFANAVQVILDASRTQVAALAAPLLDPGKPVAPGDAVAAGLGIGLSRRSAADALRALIGPVRGMAAADRVEAALTVCRAFAESGLTQESIAFAHLAAPAEGPARADLAPRLAALLREHGHEQQAAETLEAALAAADAETRAALLYALLQIEADSLKRYDRALDHAGKLIALTEGSPARNAHARYNAAAIHYRVGRYADAFAALEAIPAAARAGLSIDLLAGRSLAALGRYDEGVQRLKLAGEGTGEDAAYALLLAGTIVREQGDSAYAASFFSLAVSRAPESRTAARAKAMLRSVSPQRGGQ